MTAIWYFIFMVLCLMSIALFWIGGELVRIRLALEKKSPKDTGKTDGV